MNDNYTIVKDNIIKEDSILSLNESYSACEFCEYSDKPVTRSTDFNFEVVKEAKEDPKNTYHNVSYSL